MTRPAAARIQDDAIVPRVKPTGYSPTRTGTRSDTRDPPTSLMTDLARAACPARCRRWRLPEREFDSALAGWAGAEDAALGLLDRDVVDARLATAHQAVLVELPQLIAVAAPPMAIRVVGLVLEPDRDPVLAERPQVLAQGIVELAVPL